MEPIRDTRSTGVLTSLPDPFPCSLCDRPRSPFLGVQDTVDTLKVNTRVPKTGVSRPNPKYGNNSSVVDKCVLVVPNKTTVEVSRLTVVPHDSTLSSTRLRPDPS